MKHDLVPGSLEARADRRVRIKLFFYKHALVFVLVNLGLYVRDVLRGHTHGSVILWGWATFLAIHGVLTVIRLQSEGLRERMLREEIERMRRDKP